MKKIVSIILGIMIFAIPCFAFANTTITNDVNYSLMQKYNSSGDSNCWIEIPGNTVRNYFIDSDDTVYFLLYGDSLNNVKYLCFSENPNNTVYIYTDGNLISSHDLVNEYNGYYYVSVNQTAIDASINISNKFDSPTDYIDYLFNSSPVLVINSLIDGSVSWLSTIVQAVKSYGLLLFMVLIGFIGIGIGLFRRFVNG